MECDSVVLRRYRSADLWVMFAMDVQCFDEVFRFDLRSMRRFAEARNAIVVVAEKHGSELEAAKLLGFVIVHVERVAQVRRGYVVTLDVLPTERRTGIAGRLMSRVEELAVERGIDRMELHVFTKNEAAIRFYEGMGYVRRFTSPGFYGSAAGATVDAFVYGKRLPQL